MFFFYQVTIIGEWNSGKEDGQSHGREKERERRKTEKKKRHKSRTPTHEPWLPAPARKLGWIVETYDNNHTDTFLAYPKKGTFFFNFKPYFVINI